MGTVAGRLQGCSLQSVTWGTCPRRGHSLQACLPISQWDTGLPLTAAPLTFHGHKGSTWWVSRTQARTPTVSLGVCPTWTRLVLELS